MRHSASEAWNDLRGGLDIREGAANIVDGEEVYKA